MSRLAIYAGMVVAVVIAYLVGSKPPPVHVIALYVGVLSGSALGLAGHWGFSR